MSNVEKKKIIDTIFELLIKLSEDGESPVSQANETAHEEDKPVEMLTIRECTKIIHGLSEHTVRQLVRQGKVKSVRTGAGRNGKILVNKADLVEYFQGKGA